MHMHMQAAQGEGRGGAAWAQRSLFRANAFTAGRYLHLLLTAFELELELVHALECSALLLEVYTPSPLLLLLDSARECVNCEHSEQCTWHS